MLVSLCQPTRAGRPAVVQRCLRWRSATEHNTKLVPAVICRTGENGTMNRRHPRDRCGHTPPPGPLGRLLHDLHQRHALVRRALVELHDRDLDCRPWLMWSVRDVICQPDMRLHLNPGLYDNVTVGAHSHCSWSDCAVFSIFYFYISRAMLQLCLYILLY